MCLIVHKPAVTVFHETWLRDFYKCNDDGFGFMYADSGKLNVHKSLGSASRFVEIFEKYKDRECLIHLRMRTHGDIDLDNCHPYEVLTPEEGGELGAVWMMHNGVLGYGNEAGKNKSDTWHYINSLLRPILLKCPALLLESAFQHLVEREIGGSNRFAFMSGRGDTVILNKSQGVMWNEAWMSNTYAWSASDAKIPGVYSNYGGNYGYSNYGSKYTSAWRWSGNKASAVVPYTAPVVVKGVNAGEVFSLLREKGFTDAYTELSMPEMNAAIENSPIGMEELQAEITSGAFKPTIDDEFVIKWVRRLSTMSKTEAEAEEHAKAKVVAEKVKDEAAAAANAMYAEGGFPF